MTLRVRSMPADNSEQIAEWNGALGQRWVAMQREIDRIVVPFGDAALKAAAPQPGERVIDIGCGCGDTSIEIARIVGEAGAVVGIDVSQPMLEVARSRGALANCAHLAFRDGDASEAGLPANTDLLFSRFGVMFFSQPSQAFSHLRKSLRTGGRCVFVCWRAPRDNAWAMTPLSAARTAMGVTPTPADPDAPGPFAFADDEKLRAILSGAGFGAIDVRRFDAALSLGATPRSAAEGAVQIGPVSRFVREVGVEYLPIILDAVERTLVPLAAPDGHVSLNGSTWIVSATNPA
ncbi:MAG: methyltransferase domain-containing protein [Actinobacteria bacterium]|nr:MAG: methyltransferase domain-containing protein [Actinomycetota bacterium]